MNWRDHIDRNPLIIGGKPKIKGTRIGVEVVLERLGEGWSIEQLIEAYPRITADQIHACQAYAAAMLSTDEVVDVPQSAALRCDSSPMRTSIAPSPSGSWNEDTT